MAAAVGTTGYPGCFRIDGKINPGGSVMFNRRTFLSLAAGGITAPRLASAQQASRKVALYANVGADLTHYDVDVASAELITRETVTLPAGVQYAWPHASRRYLYVASSSSASGYGKAGTEHHVTAFSIDPATGALSPHGAPIRLPTRPIHISTDILSENILVAFNTPRQVRVTPDNRLAILVTRGNEGTPTKPEDPGALKGLRLQERRADQGSVHRAQ